MALVSLIRATTFLRIHQLSKFSFSFLTEKSIKNATSSLFFHIPCNKYYCTDEKPAIPPKSAPLRATEESKKRKSLKSPQITLIDSEDIAKVSTLENAEKLAKRRNLKLVKIVDFDTKSERPVYKLMTSADFFEENKQSKERKRNEKQSMIKDCKMYTISSKIGDNDLAVKVRNISRALKKKYLVRIYVLQDASPSKLEEVGKLIEEELAEFYSTKEVVRKNTALKMLLNPKIENETVNENKKEKETIQESEKEKVKPKIDFESVN